MSTFQKIYHLHTTYHIALKQHFSLHFKLFWINLIELDKYITIRRGFACENNKIISIEKRCNGKNDCRHVAPLNLTDYSDERYCRK